MSVQDLAIEDDEDKLTIAELQSRAFELQSSILAQIRAFEERNGQPVERIRLTHVTCANGRQQTAAVRVEVPWVF